MKYKAIFHFQTIVEAVDKEMASEMANWELDRVGISLLVLPLEDYNEQIQGNVPKDVD